MITVMGASGNTGKRIAENLLRAGEKVRVMGRSADKLAPFKSSGAEVLTGDPSDAAFLLEAFKGAEAAYTLFPPDIHSSDYRAQQDRQGEAITRAIGDSGVRNVVFLSSVGADLAAGTGPIAGLHAQEERLRGLSGTNVLILRCAYFFENFYSTLGLIKHQGINGGAMARDIPIAMIATCDIADAAAQALRARDFNGVVVRELLGQRDLSQAEATRILGERIGKPDLQYMQFPYADFVAALFGMGISKNVSELYAEMSRAFNEGKIRSLEGRTASNTTPTRFEDFADGLSKAYEAA